MSRMELINWFLEYLQINYYDNKMFSNEIANKIISTINKLNDDVEDAIMFFYWNDPEINEAADTSGAIFKNKGQRLSYIIGIWYNSYKNGYVHVKRRTNDEIIKEVC